MSWDMPDHRAEAALRRSLDALSIGPPVEGRMDPMLAKGDLSQMVQVDVTGRAGTKVTVQQTTVSFEHPFATLLMPTEDDIEEPHFTYGVRLRSPSPVIIQPQIADWVVNDSSFIVGARVNVLAHAPGASSAVPFSGKLHLKFAGYAVPTEDDE